MLKSCVYITRLFVIGALIKVFHVVVVVVVVSCGCEELR